MPDVSATEAARNLSALLDSVEHEGQHYTIVRHGKAVAHLEPVRLGRGTEVKDLLRHRRPDPAWRSDLNEVRDILELEDRA